MVLLFCFALSYALVGTAAQVGRDARGGLQVARQRAWATATRRVANMRAGGPRHVGWWAWLTGATVYHTVRYTVRGTRLVARSVRTGWSAGWRRGRERYETYQGQRTTGRGGSGSDRTFADRWRRTRADQTTDDDQWTGGGPVGGDERGEEPVQDAYQRTPADQDRHGDATDDTTSPSGSESQPAGDGSSERGSEEGDAMALTACERCGVYAGRDHVCAHPAEDWKQTQDGERHGACSTDGNGTGALVMVSATTGEAPNIEAARTVMQALRTEAEQTVSRVDQLAGSLQSANVDAQTLGEVAEVLDNADAMKAAADKALAGLQSRHAVMEEAVNSTPHAANTDWYRH